MAESYKILTYFPRVNIYVYVTFSKATSLTAVQLNEMYRG